MALKSLRTTQFFIYRISNGYWILTHSRNVCGGGTVTSSDHDTGVVGTSAHNSISKYAAKLLLSVNDTLRFSGDVENITT